MSTYRIICFIPENCVTTVKEAVNKNIEPLYPHYDFVFTEMKVQGSWRPLEGANPAEGEIGKICEASEIRLEFCCKEKNLRQAIEAVKKAHPYEEPVIDAVKVLTWKDILA